MNYLTTRVGLTCIALVMLISRFPAHATPITQSRCALNIVPGEVINVSEDDDVVWNLSVSCRGGIQTVISVEIDGSTVSAPDDREFYPRVQKQRFTKERSNDTANQAIDMRVLLLSKPINSGWAEGKHAVKVQVKLESGIVERLSTNFEIHHAALDKKQSSETVDLSSAGKQSTQSVTQSQAGVDEPWEQNVPQQLQQIAPGCAYKFKLFIPYFDGPTFGVPKLSITAEQKKALWDSSMKDAIAAKLSAAIQAPAPAGKQFTGIQLQGDSVIMSEPQPISISGWNSNGLAKINTDTPSYMGVPQSPGEYVGVAAASQVSQQALVALRNFVKTLEVGDNEIPILLVDFVLPQNGSYAQTEWGFNGYGGYYVPDDRFLVVALAKDPGYWTISNFRLKEILHSVGEGSLPYWSSLTLAVTIGAHEIGHSFGLGHHNAKNQNLMHSKAWETGNNFIGSQSCAVRAICQNGLPLPQVSMLFANANQVIAAPCSIGMMQTEDLFLDPFTVQHKESCEGFFGGYDRPFNYNCNLDNPTNNSFDFSETDPSLREVWGKISPATPNKCYSKIPPGSNYTPEAGKPPSVNNCRVREFCGNHFLDPEEECDSAFNTPDGPTDNPKCSVSETCGGMAEDPGSGKQTKYNCMCVKKECPDGKRLIGPPCNICCQEDEICDISTKSCKKKEPKYRITGR